MERNLLISSNASCASLIKLSKICHTWGKLFQVWSFTSDPCSLAFATYLKLSSNNISELLTWINVGGKFDSSSKIGDTRGSDGL